LAHGPKIKLAFGLGRNLVAEPELAAFTAGRVSQAGDDKFFVVAAQGHDRAEFACPLDFIFRIKTCLSCP
jgi:hypothetical protein